MTDPVTRKTLGLIYTPGKQAKQDNKKEWLIGNTWGELINRKDYKLTIELVKHRKHKSLRTHTEHM